MGLHNFQLGDEFIVGYLKVTWYVTYRIKAPIYPAANIERPPPPKCTVKDIHPGAFWADDLTDDQRANLDKLIPDDPEPQNEDTTILNTGRT